MRKLILVDYANAFQPNYKQWGKMGDRGMKIFFLFQVDGLVPEAELRAGSDLQVRQEFG
ncbi:hypothetical protein CCY01nite_23900 [Chitinophaga cymbidii]|uniref:Uncharacterized protein n=1 Tax=Chitinophaga cymbidii TaxID=1096750 RepID=A0A512RKD4_9BACT|nr:hypothetical protein CCY01nite_23900 [Chitinophaga cymbidii]